MTLTQILERLAEIDRAIVCGAGVSHVQRKLDALKLDIEIHCTRTGVPLV